MKAPVKVAEQPPQFISSQASDSVIGTGQSKVRKFGVIKDPVQVFQDHKRRRT